MFGRTAKVGWRGECMLRGKCDGGRKPCEEILARQGRVFLKSTVSDQAVDGWAS